MKESFRQSNDSDNGVEKFEKYREKDIKFFDGLAEKYGLEQGQEHLIVNKNGKKAYILKAREIPTQNGKIKIEKLIQDTLDELGE